METTKHKVGRVLLTITLIIAFLGCMLMAITLPFLNTVGVASADSSAGVVKDNLFSNPTFDLTGDGVFSFQNYFKQDIVYTNGASLTLNNNVLVASTTTSGSGHWVAFLFKPTETGTYTFTINADFVGSSGYLWRLRDTNYSTYVDSSSINFSNYQYVTYNITDLSKNYILQMVMPTANVSTNIYWVKFEKSSSFTGYVPKYYSNFGYNQGLEEGYNNEFDLRNYRLLDPFSYTSSTSTNINFPSNHYSTSFTFDNKRFGVSTYYPVTSLVPTAYNNLCPFYTLYSSTTTYYNGIKYSNDLLSGDILITFPFRFANNDFDMMFCFEDTVTGSLNYVTSKDSLHWFWGDVIGTTYGSYQVFTCQVHYYSANPVNLYVFQVGLNPVYNTTDIDVIVTRAIWFPLDCIWANIYATSTGSALNDFDSGYNKGKEDGIASVNTDNYYNYGYRQGYDKGHTDGVAEHTNYSFLGLISAVVDAPIKAFSGLLEFEILGVNLKNFVLGLLTLAVIIIIIKIALGGK